jgi:hypothetical protein
LSKGYSKDQIYRNFDDDIGLISAWIEFLKYKKWVVELKEEKEEKVDIDSTSLKVTKEGNKTWLRSFESANIRVTCHAKS